MIAYKQFRMDKSGNLHPLFVNVDETIPVGKWLVATEGKRLPTGKVKSKLGPLAYRPGWHLSECPLAPHIGLKDASGKVRWMHPDTVWAECEVYDEQDYTWMAKMNGKGSKACLDHLPWGGYYWFNTNPNAYGLWLIAHRIKVLRVMTDAEVEQICWTQFGVHAQPRKAV